MRLNLGSGDLPLPGWINVDLAGKPDVKFDIAKAWPIKDGSVDEIMAVHSFEHVSFRHEETVWRESFRVLKKGGVLEIHTPDLEANCKQFLAGAPLFTFNAWRDNTARGRWGANYRFIFGWQEHDGHYHKSGYTKDKFFQIASLLGFEMCRVISTLSGGDIGCLVAFLRK